MRSVLNLNVGFISIHIMPAITFQQTGITLKMWDRIESQGRSCKEHQNCLLVQAEDFEFPQL